MAATLHDDVFDNGLAAGLKDVVENLYICNAKPTTFAEASATFKLGTKAAPPMTGPVNGDVSGRKVSITAITDGAITVTDTATHWAVCDDSLSKLLAEQTLNVPQAVTNGNTFTLTEIDIEIPDPA